MITTQITCISADCGWPPKKRPQFRAVVPITVKLKPLDDVDKMLRQLSEPGKTNDDRFFLQPSGLLA